MIYGWVFLIFGHSDAFLFGNDIEVTCMEKNTIYTIYYDSGKPPAERWCAREQFRQMIGWKWDRGSYWHADFWVVGHVEPSDYRDGWYIFWLKSGYGPPVRVKARQFLETHTSFDPEVADRQVYPMELRGGLYPLKKVLEGKRRYWYDDKEIEP